MESKYDYVVFDIETTGLHPDSDQICEIAAIGVKDGLPQGTFSTLVAIEGSMPEAARELWPDLPGRSMDSLRGILGIERTDAHRALADCYDELAVLNAELSVIMQSYARKMDYCRGELLRIAGEIAEEIGE